MRLAILAIPISLALCGCGKEQATGNTSALDQTVTAEDFDTGDTTAIDAATGADANMAADVDINVTENAGGNGSSPSTVSPARRERPAPSATGNTSQGPADDPSEPAASEPANTSSD